MPEYVTKQEVEKGIQATVSKKKLNIAGEIDFYNMTEGRCIQMLHIGSFEREPETLKQIGEFISVNKLKNNGRHHEIYLSNFKTTAPEKLKTILREPVK
ncbi:MAG: GyrI-like domain-containing protein [Segetibacter sp.]